MLDVDVRPGSITIETMRGRYSADRFILYVYMLEKYADVRCVEGGVELGWNRRTISHFRAPREIKDLRKQPPTLVSFTWPADETWEISTSHGRYMCVIFGVRRPKYGITLPRIPYTIEEPS